MVMSRRSVDLTTLFLGRRPKRLTSTIVLKLAFENAFFFLNLSSINEKLNIFSPILSSEFVVKCTGKKFGNRIKNKMFMPQNNFEHGF